MHQLLSRLLFLTDSDFRRTGLTGTDYTYTRRALFSFMLYHFPENECLDFLDPIEAQSVLKSARDFVLAFTSITDQAHARQDMQKVDSALRDSFGDIVYSFFKTIGAWCDRFNAGRVAEIFSSLKSICEKRSKKHLTFVESKIQELRAEYQQLNGNPHAFDAKLREIRYSMDIMRRLHALYDNAPSPKNSDNIETLRNFYKSMNGPDSLLKFDSANRKRLIRHFQGVAQKFDQEVKESLLKKPTLGVKAAATAGCPVSESFQHAVESTHDLIRRLKDREAIIIDTANEEKLLLANCRKWAKLHVDVIPAEKGTGSTFPANNSIASAVFKHDKVPDYKAAEYTLIVSNLKPTTTLFDLGDAYPCFRQSRIIHRIEHGLCCMALVETKFAPYLVFIRGENDCKVHLGTANSTIRVTAECSDKGAVARDFRLDLVLVEIKFCAACGQPAKNKCTVCWSNCRACIRYCSRECFRADYKRHKGVCGRDFGEVWESASSA